MLRTAKAFFLARLHTSHIICYVAQWKLKKKCWCAKLEDILRGEKRFIHFANTTYCTISQNLYFIWYYCSIHSHRSYQPTMNPLVLSEILRSWLFSAVSFLYSYKIMSNIYFILDSKKKCMYNHKWFSTSILKSVHRWYRHTSALNPCKYSLLYVQHTTLFTKEISPVKLARTPYTAHNVVLYIDTMINIITLIISKATNSNIFILDPNHHFRFRFKLLWPY